MLAFSPLLVRGVGLGGEGEQAPQSENRQRAEGDSPREVLANILRDPIEMCAVHGEFLACRARGCPGAGRPAGRPHPSPGTRPLAPVELTGFFGGIADTGADRLSPPVSVVLPAPRSD